MPIGVQGFVMFGKNASNILTTPSTTGNLAATVGMHTRPFAESFQDNYDRYDTANMQGSLYEPDDTTGILRVGGGISLAAHPEQIGHFLFGALGTNGGTTTVVSGFYLNSFRNTTSDVHSSAALSPYTIEVYRPEISNGTTSYVYNGMCTTKLGLSFAVNKPVMIDAEYIGYDSTQLTRAGTSSWVFPNSPTYPYRFHQTSISLGGLAYGHMESFKVDIDNQLVGIPTLNATSLIRRISRSAPPMIRFSGTLALDNYTDYTSFKNQTEMQITLGLFSANSYRCDITMPRCVIIKHAAPISGRDRIMASFEGKAFYSDSNAYTIVATLSSVRSAYT